MSSTAVTFSSARRAAEGEGSPHILAAGVALATGVSFIRVAAIILALKPSLLPLTVGILIMIGRLVYDEFGTSGAIAGAATMGLFDVDAMTVSMTRLVPELLSPHGATYAILAGVAANSLSKVAISAFIGRGRFAIGVATACIVSTVAGGLILLATLKLLHL